jgi:hypothetical protein
MKRGSVVRTAPPDADRYRLTDEERRFKFGNPAVVTFRSVKKGDERPRFNDGGHRALSL